MEFQTERLKFRELTSGDLTDIHQLHSLPQTDEFNTMGIPASIEVTSILLQGWLKQQETVPRISYIFCVELIESGEFIGLIALNLGKLNYRIAEIWYKIHPTYWTQGYATEALKKILDVGFIDLKLHRIEAGCAVENEASIKVLEKSGMTREGEKERFYPSGANG